MSRQVDSLYTRTLSSQINGDLSISSLADNDIIINSARESSYSAENLNFSATAGKAVINASSDIELKSATGNNVVEAIDATLNLTGSHTVTTAEGNIAHNADVITQTATTSARYAAPTVTVDATVQTQVKAPDVSVVASTGTLQLAGDFITLTSPNVVDLPASKLTSALDADGQLVQHLGYAVNCNDAASKLYVDAKFAGVNPTNACKVGTVDNLVGTAPTAQNLEASANGPLLPIDNETGPLLPIVVGDRILVKDQTEAQDNGIYDIVNLGSATTKWQLRRSANAITDTQIAGADVLVIQGMVNGGKGFVCTNVTPFKVGGPAGDLITYVLYNLPDTLLDGALGYTVSGELCVKLADTTLETTSNFSGGLRINTANNFTGINEAFSGDVEFNGVHAKFGTAAYTRNTTLESKETLGITLAANDGTNRTLVLTATNAGAGDGNILLTANNTSIQGAMTVNGDLTVGANGDFDGTLSCNAATDNKYSFPITKGTSGQVATSNGAGSSIWATPWIPYQYNYQSTVSSSSILYDPTASTIITASGEQTAVTVTQTAQYRATFVAEVSLGGSLPQQLSARVFSINTKLSSLAFESITRLTNIDYLPGYYSTTAAATITGRLGLNGDGDPDAVFVFYVNGALTSAVGSLIFPYNGTQSKNIFFVVNGAYNSLSNIYWQGTIIAKTSIAFGNSDKIEGRVYSLGGAIVLGPNSNLKVLPPDSSPLVELGVLASWSVFTVIGAISTTSTAVIIGEILTGQGNISGFGVPYDGTFSSSIVEPKICVDLALYNDASLIEQSMRCIEASVGDCHETVIACNIAVDSGSVISCKCCVKLSNTTCIVKTRCLNLTRIYTS
jgi:hypothetical protein